MTYVPEFVAIHEVIPFSAYLPLDNETIRVAVKDYLKGGKERIVINNTIAKKLLPESHVCKRYRWNTQVKKFDGKKPFRPKTRSHKGNKMRY